MNNLKVNSQKKFNLKGVVSNEKQNICYLCTEKGKVTLRGIGINNAIDNKRYNEVFDLIATMENKLDNNINFNINISYIELEALVKVYLEMQDDKQAKEFFLKNISPKNFFFLINDLDNQKFYHSSRKIYTLFLSSTSELKALNDFYNEFSDVIDNSFKHKHNISNLYVYFKREDFLDKDKYKYLRNIGNALNGNDKKEKEISFHLINEYYTTKMKSYLSDSSRDELFYKIQTINDNWSKIMKEIESSEYSNEYSNIDKLYDLCDI